MHDGGRDYWRPFPFQVGHFTPQVPQPHPFLHFLSSSSTTPFIFFLGCDAPLLWTSLTFVFTQCKPFDVDRRPLFSFNSTILDPFGAGPLPYLYPQSVPFIHVRILLSSVYRSLTPKNGHSISLKQCRQSTCMGSTGSSRWALQSAAFYPLYFRSCGGGMTYF